MNQAPSLVRGSIAINTNMISNIFDQRIKTFEDRVLSERGDPILKNSDLLESGPAIIFQGFHRVPW